MELINDSEVFVDKIQIFEASVINKNGQTELITLDYNDDFVLKICNNYVLSDLSNSKRSNDANFAVSNEDVWVKRYMK